MANLWLAGPARAGRRGKDKEGWPKSSPYRELRELGSPPVSQGKATRGLLSSSVFVMFCWKNHQGFFCCCISVVYNTYIYI